MTFSHSPTATAERSTFPDAALMTVDDVAALLACSVRHVRRLADSGAMPRPVRMGSLVRWRGRTGDPMTGVHDWVEAGCPSCREQRRAGR